MLNPEVFVLYFHGRSDVDLDGKHTFQCATLFIQVDEIRRLMTIDPVLIVVALDEHSIVVPLVCGKVLYGNLADDPRLTVDVHNDLLAGMRKDATSPLFIEYSVVVWIVRNDIALIAGNDVEPEIGAQGTTILQATVATRADLNFDVQFKIAHLRSSPSYKAVHLQRAICDTR